MIIVRKNPKHKFNFTGKLKIKSCSSVKRRFKVKNKMIYYRKRNLRHNLIKKSKRQLRAKKWYLLHKSLAKKLIRSQALRI